MKIAVIFLDYERHTYSERTLQCIVKSGYPFDLFTIQRKGIAAALNEGIDKTRDYDAIVTCANDIELPQNWLIHMIKYAEQIPQSGMIGFHTVESLPDIQYVNTLPVHPIFTAFGNVMIPRKAIDTIGYFNEAHDPYGMQDADYAFRLNNTGFINYYIPELKAVHIGHDIGEQSDYRSMKDEGLIKAEKTYKDFCTKYDAENNYTIFEKQFFEC